MPLTKAAPHDLQNLHIADWGEEVEAVGLGFFDAIIEREAESRPVGGAASVRFVSSIRTTENIPVTTQLRFEGILYRVGQREMIEGLWTYSLDRI